MANEELTIQKNKARLKVIGNSYPDTLTNSGEGPDLTQELIDWLDDLGIDLPDIDPDDWDDIDAIIGYDDDGNPILIYPDPDTGELIEWPIDFPIDPEDWPDLDVTPTLNDDDLPVIEFEDPDTGDIIQWPITLPDDVDPEDWPDMDITAGLDDDGNPIISFDDIDLEVGKLDIDDLVNNWDLDWMTDLDITGLDNIAFLDDELKVNVSDLPAYISVVFPPNKTTYLHGQAIDISGLYVYAYKSDGTVWRGTEKPGDPYRSGRIPNNELMIDPRVAKESESGDDDFVASGMLPKGDVVISTNNGDRTPVVKHGNGAAAGFVSYNIHTDTTWGGGWIGAGIITTGGASLTGGYIGGNSAVVDGKRVTLLFMSTNPNWGNGREGSGATSLTNPLGLPAVGVLSPVNVQPTSETVAAVVRSMGFQAKPDNENTVTVEWNRPGDGRTLRTFFEITIQSGGGGGR